MLRFLSLISGVELDLRARAHTIYARPCVLNLLILERKNILIDL
jgi:hypothetical protein